LIRTEVTTCPDIVGEERRRSDLIVLDPSAG
jgi:hypothetical protein